MIKNIKWLLFASLSIVACNDDDATVAEEPVTAGSANFTKYVALGDSFAAGYSDGALFMKGQDHAYPVILAKQFAEAGGGTFTTPYMEDNVGGFSNGANQIPQFPQRLYFNGVGPVNVSGTSSTVLGAHISGTFSNLGVPGAKSFHLLAAGYGNPAGLATNPPMANPYFVRFASSSSTSVLADALTQQPTFFSLWIGGNDVLGYATAGGVKTSEDAAAGNDITPTATFDTAYNTLVTQLVSGGRKGVVANLPLVNTLPYFTTVPYNPVTLDATKVSQLNSGYTSYNNALAFAVSNSLITQDEANARKVVFQVGANPVVIVDNYLTNLTAYGIPSYRPATKADFLVLPSRSFIGTLVGGNPSLVNGVSVPLADKWVLCKNEAAEIATATEAYNATIESAATANGLAMVDAKGIMNRLVNGGIRFGNYHMSASYVTGGAFSLDGVHPSARGYALIANEFAKAINTKYGSTLRQVDLGQYQIQYPASL